MVYVHDDSNTTADSFTFDIQDGSGNNLTGQTLSISINLIDDDVPTVSTNTGLTLNEGATAIIDSGELQANDTDTDNDNLTYAITGSSSNGQVELTTSPGVATTSFTQAQLNANQVVYVHDDSNTTSDSFTFDVQDGSGNNLTGQTFNISINPVNDDVPIALDDPYITDEDQELVVTAPGLFANDTDPDTETAGLSAVLVAGTSNGTLSLNSDGSFTYLPDQDFNGTDLFSYKVSDGVNESNTATVTITVKWLTIHQR